MTSDHFSVDAVLFDFDMTLVDSSYAIHHCTNLLAEKLGFRNVPREEVLAAIGLTIEDSWRSFWGDFRQEWVDFYRANYREEEQSRLKLFDGAEEVMRELKAGGVKVGVVSNRRFARRAVEAVKLTEIMDVIIGLEDVERAKPAPDPLYKGFELLGASPAAGLYVGDTDIDMKTAIAAGSRGVGMTTGNFNADELIAAGAWRVLSSIREVPSAAREKTA